MIESPVAGIDPESRITDVAGIRVGSVTRIGDAYLTGTTVVLPPPGTVGGVEVRGGGPGTRETDALKPGTLVPTADAVVLTGGSAYGLITASGAMRWCAENGRGVPVGRPGQVVPVVPAAVIFDLGRGGSFAARPEEDWGYRAAEIAYASDDHAPVERGTTGAATGAMVADQRLKGGLGTASTTVQIGAATITVGALAAVNARGVPQLVGVADALADAGEPDPAALNTTIAVVATDARLDVADTTRTAACAHDGLARAIDPVHTLGDGDCVFALATGAVPLPEDPRQRIEALVAVQAAAATALQAAVLDGVRRATSVTTPAGTFPALFDTH